MSLCLWRVISLKYVSCYESLTFDKFRSWLNMHKLWRLHAITFVLSNMLVSISVMYKWWTCHYIKREKLFLSHLLSSSLINSNTCLIWCLFVSSSLPAIGEMNFNDMPSVLMTVFTERIIYHCSWDVIIWMCSGKNVIF